MKKQTSKAVLPSAPVDLVAVAIGGSQVLLAWTECEADALAFRIERADGIGSGYLFSEIGRTGVHVAVFRDGTVIPRASYTYRVHAWNDSGVSLPSNVVEVMTSPVETERPADMD